MLQTIGVLSAIVLIIFLATRKVNLGIAILLGSAVIIVTSGATTDLTLGIFSRVFGEVSTYELVLSIAFIGILGFVLKETQLIQDMIQELKKILPRRALIALIPAIFGTLPMPGGALVSAPLIDKEAEELGLAPEKKTFVNLWFRHLSLFVIPLSSSLILAARFSNVNIYDLILFQVPVFLFMILLGYLFLRTVHEAERHREGNVSFKRTILGIMPVLVAIVLNMIGLRLPFALLIGILVAFLIRRNRVKDAPAIIWKGLNKGLLLTTFSVLVFRGVVTETQAFSEIFFSLQEIGVPPAFFFIIFPFLIGFVAAIPTSGIAIGFPMVLPLFTNITLPMVSLMYLSIMIGYEISPMHLCLILTNEYYRSKIQSVYRLWGPMLMAAYLFSIAATLLLGARYV